MRSSWYRDITWGLIQLFIRQHLHIMSTADRLFMKSHQEDEDKKIQLHIKNKWRGRWTWASRVVKRLVAQVPIAFLVACCSNNKKSMSMPKFNNDFHVSEMWACNFVCCSATLLAFLVELLKSSVAMQEQMLGGKGFLVIGYLLEKVSEETCRMKSWSASCWVD